MQKCKLFLVFVTMGLMANSLQGMKQTETPLQAAEKLTKQDSNQSSTVPKNTGTTTNNPNVAAAAMVAPANPHVSGSQQSRVIFSSSSDTPLSSDYQTPQYRNNQELSQIQITILEDTRRLLGGINNAAERIADAIEKSLPKPDNNKPQENFYLTKQQIEKVSQELEQVLIDTCPEALKRVLNIIQYAAMQTDITSRNFFLKGIPNLVLFVGPPGVGKTSTGVAIAQRLQWKLKFQQAAAICNTFKNSGIVGLQKLFGDILASGNPTVIILDEITSLTDKYGNQHDLDANVVEYLWQIFDDIKDKRILVIATTNDASKMPSALQSRFSRDFTFSIPLPNDNLRRLTFKICLPRSLETECLSVQNKITEKETSSLVSQTKGFSQRDIEGVVSKAQNVAKGRGIAKKMAMATQADPEPDIVSNISKIEVIIIFNDLKKEINAMKPDYVEITKQTCITAWPYIQMAFRFGYTCLTLSWQIYWQIKGHQLQINGLKYQKKSLNQSREARTESQQNFAAQMLQSLNFHGDQLRLADRQYEQGQTFHQEQISLSLLLNPSVQEKKENKEILNKMNKYLEVLMSLIKTHGFELSNRRISNKHIQCKFVEKALNVFTLEPNVELSDYYISNNGKNQLESYREKARIAVGLTRVQEAKIFDHLDGKINLADQSLPDNIAEILKDQNSNSTKQKPN